MMGTSYVWVERTLFDGRMTTEWVPALVAAHEAVHGPQNGLTVASLRVLWGDVLDEFTRSA